MAAKGVIFTDLDSAVQQHPELVQPHLMTECVRPHDGKFAALHATFWSGGSFLYVPQGVAIELPIQAITYARRGRRWAASPIAWSCWSRAAQATFVELVASGDGHGQGFASDVIRLIGATAASLRCVHLQEWGPRVQDFSTQRAIIGRDATINWLVVTLGGQLSRADVQAYLNGAGLTAEMLGIFFGDGTQHFDHHTRQVHISPECQQRPALQGPLKDRARSVFPGLIKVLRRRSAHRRLPGQPQPAAQRQARADSIPNLEIGRTTCAAPTAPPSARSTRSTSST